MLIGKSQLLQHRNKVIVLWMIMSKMNLFFLYSYFGSFFFTQLFSCFFKRFLIVCNTVGLFSHEAWKTWAFCCLKQGLRCLGSFFYCYWRVLIHLSIRPTASLSGGKISFDLWSVFCKILISLNRPAQLNARTWRLHWQ